MKLEMYAHTKKKIIKKVVRNYLQGYTVIDISIKTSLTEEEINDIIDCYNYLYN
jgi:hypothetical protein